MNTTKLDATVQVVSLKGQAFIISQNGTIEPVSEGQVLPAGTLLLTDANSGIVFGDAPENAAAEQPVTADAAEETAAIQAAILAGLDPTKLFAAPAAGNPANPAQADADGSGNAGFVVVDRNGESLLAQAGFDTTFANQAAFEVFEPGLEREDSIDDVTDDTPDGGDNGGGDNGGGDNGGGDSIPEIVVIIDPPLTSPGNGGGGSDYAFVEESALPEGTNSESDNEHCTGYFDINTGSDELDKLEVRLPGGEWKDITGGGEIKGEYGTLYVELDDNGVYRWRYELKEATDKHSDPDATGANDTLPDNFEIRVTDDDGDQATAGLTVNVHDDGPMAYDDNYTVPENGDTCYNLVLIIDTSGSMKGDRLDLAKAALINLINSYDAASGELNITIIPFSDGEYFDEEDMLNLTADEAKSVIDDLEAGGFTNYEDPLEEAQEVLTNQLAEKPDYEHKVYFISDGEPNKGNPPAEWKTFVNDENIDVVAVGVGKDSEAARDALARVENDNDEPLIIKDENELDAALQDTVPVFLEGNVLENDNSIKDDTYGADGAGRVVSVTYGDETHSIPEGGSVEIETDNGGILTMYSDGKFTYTGPGNVDGDLTEHFVYTIEDKEGDQAQAQLNITVQDTDDSGDDNGNGEHPDDNDHCPHFHHWISHISLPHIAASFAGIWAHALAASDLLIDFGDHHEPIKLDWKNCPDDVDWQHSEVTDAEHYLGEQLTAYLGDEELFTFTMKPDGHYEFELHKPDYFDKEHNLHQLDFEWTLPGCDDHSYGDELVVHIGAGLEHQIGSAFDQHFSQGGEHIPQANEMVNVVMGSHEDDLLLVGEGNHILNGGDGEDIFFFDHASPDSLNCITGFEKGVDVINLSELLSNYESGNLSDYLEFSMDGTDTVLKVTTDDTGNSSQEIRFEDTNLMDLYAASGSEALIQSMVDDNTLQLDKA